MEIDLPFKAEYAKSGRAGCKHCKQNIAQGTLRLAAMVQSAFHDSKQPNWFHEDCFFMKQRPSSIGDIANIESLRFEDQERVTKKVEDPGNAVIAGKGKGKKRSNAENGAFKDFGIEYAKSARAACRGCELKIGKEEIRIRKTVYDTEVGMKYGGQALWHHVECFSKLRNELGWLACGDKLPGFESLKPEDQTIIKEALPLKNPEDFPEVKKAKIEPKDEQDLEEEKKLVEKVKSQNKRLFKFRDLVNDQMTKKEIHKLLEVNGQTPESDREKLLDQIADMLTFGALEPCDVCHGNQMLFTKSGFVCNGSLDEWTKCANLVKEPKRKSCRIPSDFKSNYDFLSGVRKKVEVRAIRYIPPSASTIAKTIKKKEDELEGPKIIRDRPPLYEFKFAHIGLKDCETEFRSRFAKLGAKYDTKINDKTIAIISTPDEVKKMSSRMQKAKDMGIHILPAKYLLEVENDGASAIRLISSMTICDWGTDPMTRLPQEDRSHKSKSIYTKSVPKSQTVKLKGGSAVDPDSGLDNVAHVYVKDKDKYAVVLGLTDIQRNKNSYYKLQLLESDTKNNYWLFRSWGRIGTTIGGSKREDYHNVIDAIRQFKDIYRDKTGNEFQDRNNFVKHPGKMYPIDVDYDEDNKIDLNAEHHIESKLSPPVQDLIKLLFDINTMKKTMLEFDLDMEKMPLGKLSRKQIQSAYKVLTELYELIEKNESQSAFISATNRFYTLIPHSFGVNSPPLLDSREQIEKLTQMLDSLAEIECAYNLIQAEDTNADINPLDKHYDQLKTKLEPVDKKSEEFALLEKYVQNTHAETHKMYELEIVDIFKVSRHGESRRYKPFKKMHNRKLLWHGSRLTNFAGILSHGLKIAPPEAPVTGYMFGKGIYFADMVSKSANYCCTSKQNSTGLLLLSEVALGDMMECREANHVTKLPNDKHSCFGRGRTYPNPEESFKQSDGVEIPFGKPITDSELQSSLLYNEYIVYDIAQVNIKYLLKMNFKYKY